MPRIGERPVRRHICARSDKITGNNGSDYRTDFRAGLKTPTGNFDGPIRTQNRDAPDHLRFEEPLLVGSAILEVLSAYIRASFLNNQELIWFSKFSLPPISGSTDIPVALAEVGDTAQAAAILREDLRKFPEDTLWQYTRGPQIEAAVEFHKIVDHPTLEPRSHDLPLAHLGLARACVLQGDTAGARDEYEKSFALWKDADKDLPVLKAAHLEYSKLPVVHP